MKKKLENWAKRLKRDIPAIFLSLQDKDTPILAKIIGGITVGYALSPVDLIPDVVPVLGYLDDVLILPALLTLTVKLIPPKVIERYRQEAKDMWEDGGPKKWYYSVPIVLLWVLIIWMIVKGFL